MTKDTDKNVILILVALVIVVTNIADSVREKLGTILFDLEPVVRPDHWLYMGDTNKLPIVIQLIILAIGIYMIAMFCIVIHARMTGKLKAKDNDQQ